MLHIITQIQGPYVNKQPEYYAETKYCFSQHFSLLNQELSISTFVCVVSLEYIASISTDIVKNAESVTVST